MSAYNLGNAPNLYNADGSPAGQMGLDGVEYPSSVSGGVPPSLLVIGDSRAEFGWEFTQGTTGVVNAPATKSSGFTAWLDALSYGLFPRMVNAGRSGRKAQLLAASDTSVSSRDTLAASVIAPSTRDALIVLGTNDILVDRTAVQIAADITTIANAAKDSGKRVTVMAELPFAAGGSWTAARQKELLRLNELLFRNSQRGQFLFVDDSLNYIDYTTTSAPQVKAGVYIDTQHFNTWGAYLRGKFLAAHYGALYAPVTRGTSRHATDDYLFDAANLNKIGNGLYSGGATTGWFVQSATGGIVTAITTGVIAAPNGIGNALYADITASGAGDVKFTTRSYDATTAFVAGDTLHAEVCYWIQGSGGAGNPSGAAGPELQCNIASDTTSRIWGMNPRDDAAITEPHSGIVRTFPYFFNGAETSLNQTLALGVRFAGAGSCRVILSGARVVKNNPVHSSNASGSWWV